MKSALLGCLQLSALSALPRHGLCLMAGDGRAFVSGYLCRFLYPHLNVFSNVDTILFIQQFSNMKVHRSLVAFTSLVVPRATFGMDDEVQQLRG